MQLKGIEEIAYARTTIHSDMGLGSRSRVLEKSARAPVVLYVIE
jgi:hypothetical protein